jgi:hypothetical protein
LELLIGIKTQEKMERGSRKRSSSARSEKLERVGDRYEKMEGYCSTGQSPQRAVVTMEKKNRNKNQTSPSLTTLQLKCPLNFDRDTNIRDKD